MTENSEKTVFTVFLFTLCIFQSNLITETMGRYISKLLM